MRSSKSTTQAPGAWWAAEENDLDITWSAGPEVTTPQNLLAIMLDMYWTGVHREIHHILVSLSKLHHAGFSDVEKDQHLNGQVQGVETFIDQICNRPSESLGDRELQWTPGDSRRPMYQFKRRLSQENANRSIKEAVKTRLMAAKRDEALNLRARVLLQAAGLLDIDKLVEYRDPPATIPLWRKGKMPQLQLERWRADALPELGPARCAACKDILRGALFQCQADRCTETPEIPRDEYLCEHCLRSGRHPPHHLTKRYKHCILDDIITPDISRKLCQCSNVPRFDSNGNDAILYPIDPERDHGHSATTMTCRLAQLHDVVTEAKCREVVAALENPRQLAKVTRDTLKDIERTQRTTNRPTRGLTASLEEALDDDVPLPLRGFTSRFPFGNTHISLMIGPLIIENGVPACKKGVLVSHRDPLNYYIPTAVDVDHEIATCLVLSGDKKIHRQRRIPRRERRLKACMKQIVGGAFSGFLDPSLEGEIIQSLVIESKFQISPSDRVNRLRTIESTTRLVKKIRRLLESRITTFLAKIVAKLLDPRVSLTWHVLSNNCQTFCDTILSWEDFGGFLAPSTAPLGQSLYLISFVVRIESYHRAFVKSKHDIPNGLTEEYLLSFRSGRHDDADIIDTLQEYWHDWGAFGGHLYKYQDVFPWDCTKAFSAVSERRCNNCDLSEHVWAFPFDSWSIIQLHLQKSRRWYAPGVHGRRELTDKEWIENRFKLLLAQDYLIRGALAMAQTSELRQSCDWFRTAREARLDRLKLGGIHRAQPFSHHFENGHFTQSLLAPWVLLRHASRVYWYEVLREMRKQAPDVNKPADPQVLAMSPLYSSIFANKLIPGLAVGAIDAHSLLIDSAGAEVLNQAANASAAPVVDGEALADLVDGLVGLLDPLHHLA